VVVLNVHNLIAMPDTTPPLPETPSALADRLFPTLTPAQLARMAAHGHPRQVRQGEVLVDVGDDSTRFFVVMTGRVDIVRVADGTE
jgi:thioredoxin reductase (NADPH)